MHLNMVKIIAASVEIVDRQQVVIVEFGTFRALQRKSENSLVE